MVELVMAIFRMCPLGNAVTTPRLGFSLALPRESYFPSGTSSSARAGAVSGTSPGIFRVPAKSLG